MGICDLCSRPVPRENDVVSLERMVSLFEEADEEMMAEEMGFTPEEELPHMLGIDARDEEMPSSRHLEPVFDSFGKIVCYGDVSRMAMILVSPKDEKKLQIIVRKRVSCLKDAYKLLRLSAVDPFSLAMSRSERREDI